YTPQSGGTAASRSFVVVIPVVAAVITTRVHAPHHDEGTAVAIAVAIEVRLRRGHDDHCRRGIIRGGPGGPGDHDHSPPGGPRHAKPYSPSDTPLRRGGRRPGGR